MSPVPTRTYERMGGSPLKGSQLNVSPYLAPWTFLDDLERVSNLASFNEHRGKVPVMAPATWRIPRVPSRDLSLYVLRMGLFTDNAYAQISVEIQRILITAFLMSISPQSEYDFFQFWSGRQGVWCITNGLPMAIWPTAWVHSTHYGRSQTTRLI